MTAESTVAATRTDRAEGRWEWRCFAPSLAAVEAGFGAAARVPPHDTAETYLLGRRDDLNLKLRDGLLDLKCLLETDANGLERWSPRGKVMLPGRAAEIGALLAPFGLPGPWQGTLTERRFLDRIAASGHLRAVAVRKSRRCFPVGDCLGELTEVAANGLVRQSVCVESTDAAALLAVLRRLGLSASANLSFPRALRRVFGCGGPPPLPQRGHGPAAQS